jgi:hypothetical protein
VLYGLLVVKVVLYAIDVDSCGGSRPGVFE